MPPSDPGYLQSAPVASEAVLPDVPGPEKPGGDPASGRSGEVWPRLRILRISARVVLGLALTLSLLGLAIIGACYINDRTISEAQGQAVAEVVDTSWTRTVIRFNDEDGQLHIPQNGALYPVGLQEGQLIRVEYDSRNPELVRVAGRGAEVAFLPVFSALAVVWAVLLPTYLVLRRSISPSR